MGKSDRKSELMAIFDGLPDADKTLLDRLIDEVVYLEARMDDLRKMPQISVNPKNPCQQKVTAAARQYKECSASYMNAVRILLSSLHRMDESAEDELFAKLREFQ